MALPIALASIVLVASGVSVSELGRFAAYQVGLLLIPGVLLWWALSGEARVTLRSVCVGWALGHAIEIGAFALCAGTGARSLTPFGIIAIGTAALVWVTVRKAARSQPADDEPLPRHWPLVCGGVVLLAIVYLAASLFTQTPLPEAVTEVSYFQDYVFHLSVSAEALHHWPIGEPKAAGESLPYHTFFYMHIAATAEVTGIELPVLLFRLVPSVLLAIIVLQLAWAGRALTGRAWAGPVAALLLIAFGELDPNPDQAFVFFNTFFYSLHTSPTFLLGLLVFIPVLVLAAELGEAKPRAGQRRGRWAALAVLLGACAGTKATILPVLAGGLIVYVAVSLALDRRVRAPLAVAGLTAAIFALSFAGLYDGGEGGLRLEPPGSIADMRPVLQLEPRFEGVPVVEQGFWVAATVLGLAGFAAASLFGTAWLFRRRLSRAPPWALFLAAVFVASLVPFLLLRHPGGSQNFFTYYGLVAAAPLAAVALLTLLSSWRGSPSGARRGLIGGAAGVCAALALGTLVDDSRELHRDAIWFGVPIVAIGATVVLATRGVRARAAAAAALVTFAVYAALDTPLDTAPDLADRARAGEPLHPTGGRGMTEGLYEGLRWLREETPEDSVLAVSNYWVDDAESAPFFSYYSGFAERRVFLEGWGYTIGTARAGPSEVATGEVHPYPDRFALNEAVFRDGDRDALARLEDAGVDYLVVDLVNRGVPGVARLGLGEPAFANSDVEIYAVPYAERRANPLLRSG